MPSNDDGLLIFHVSQLSTKILPNPQKPIQVVLYSSDLKNKLWTSTSYSYNWQQGTRLQWLNNEYFIYNDFCDVTKKYISKVISTDTLTISNICNFPVQSLFNDQFFLSINYQRLLTLNPDYGYRNKPKLTKKELLNLYDDGIWKISFRTGSSKLLISLHDVIEYSKEDSFDHSYHCINHVMISPCGNNFVFIHRYYYKSCRFDRLFIANSTNGDFKLLISSVVSHYAWIDSTTIICYLKGPDGCFGYWYINVNTKQFVQFPHFQGLGDGHPSISGNYIISDTYPDKSRLQSINLYDKKKNRIANLGQFYHSFQFKDECRCDLHPRNNLSKNEIYLDSVFNGKRQFLKIIPSDI